MDQQQSHAVTASAPIEGNISTEHVYTDILYCTLPAAVRTYSGLVSAFVMPHLNVVGNVDLVSLTFGYNFTAGSQFVKAGLYAAGSNASLEQVAAKPNGISTFSNTLTCGPRVWVEMVPEDTLSKQLYPQSSLLPMMGLKFEVSKEVMVSIVVKIKVNGMRQQFVTLK